MKKQLCSIVIAVLVLVVVTAQSTLDGDVYKKIAPSVFEVIVDKHDGQNIVYDRELPVDRIPFAVRKDKYTPIGTAFLLTDGRFYTAKHVLNLYGYSVHDKFYIRDTNEKVYEIENLLSFSERRDFVSFTAKDFQFKEGMGLTASDNFEINSTVFSVGNALGEGIIIRNGTLTSQTYEAKNGDWKWLRFSAAASPGNSGGPLITPDGKVIGIITMKSENENLNYALPIKEIHAEKPNTGTAYRQYQYVLPNILSYKHPFEFSEEIALPKSLAEVHAILTQAYDANIKKCVEEMKQDYGIFGNKSFEKSTQKDEFYSVIYGTTFPKLIYLNQNGTWDLASPSQTQTYNLPDNGYIDFGSMLGYYFARIHKPDSVPLEKLIKNPKIYADYLCKAFSFSRNYSGDKVNITSFGEPEKSETYKDAFGRTWYVNYFGIDFADSMFMTFALPQPTGLYIMATVSQRADILTTNYLDAQVMADYTYPRWGARIKFWREFLALPKDISENFSDLQKSISLKEEKNSLSFTVENISFTVNKKDIKYNDDASIVIRTGYTSKNNKLCLDARNVMFTTDSKKDDYKFFAVAVIRNPGKDAKEDLQTDWQQIARNVSPYNEEPFTEDQVTALYKVVCPDQFKNGNPVDADYLYIFSFEVDGQNKFNEIKKFSKKISESITIK